MEQPSALDRLTAAGLVDEKHLDEEHKKAINSLTDEEVQALLNLRQKLGAAPDDRPQVRPNIIL